MSQNLAASSFVGDLVVSMLTVNNFSLEKACEMRPVLEEAGFFDVEVLSKMSHEQVFSALKNAGYTKADYVVGLLADRLQAMASTMRGTPNGEIRALLKPGRERDLDRFLLAIKGVGPAVLETFRAFKSIRAE